METLINRHSQIMDKYDSEKRIALVVDEWGCWHKVEPGTNPGFLYQQNTIRDALVAGLTLNIFNNHSDRVRIANIAQAVNVLQSPVLTEGDKIVLTPTWHVFNMYKKHHDANLLESAVSAGFIGTQEAQIPALNVSASEKDGNYFVTICNTDASCKKEISVALDGLDISAKQIECQVIEGDSMTSFNSFDEPNTVTAKSLESNHHAAFVQSLVPRKLKILLIFLRPDEPYFGKSYFQ